MLNLLQNRQQLAVNSKPNQNQILFTTALIIYLTDQARLIHMDMNTFTITNAKAQLSALIKHVLKTGEPVLIGSG